VSLLYPRMTQRPPNFRLNPASPLAQGLVFFGGGLVPGGSRMYDGSIWGYHSSFDGLDPATDWTYVPELGRWAIGGFADTGDRILLPNNTAAKPAGAMTVTWWVKGHNVYADYPCGVGALSRSGSRDYALALQHTIGGDTDVIGFIAVSATGVYTVTATNVNPKPPAWHCFCMRYIPSVELRIFADGVSAAVRTDSVPVTQYHNDFPVAVGTLYDGNEGCFVGASSDVLIHARALTDSEISALADPGNVDLRVGGVPLILPPRRRICPAAVAGVTFNPAWAQGINSYLGMGS